ncbi:MAG: gluconate 2-dehydrogenase subunit 3 family protein [Gemmatimonadota bacterium]|nr:gluconate 2-dehydrogenase subunit 3 family protein [Gemmatimonadota bacterium]
MTSRRSRYPDYDVLDKWESADWDDQTRAVVRRRLEQVPPVRFLTPEEARLLQAVCDRILPGPDRGPRVPIVPWIDEKLFHDRRDGYRYEEVPPLREAWRLGLAGIDESARLLHGGRSFSELDVDAQDDVLRRVARGEAPGAPWGRLSAIRFFRDVLCLTAVKIYYAHPRAWSEIGYGGPSSPRGHVRTWIGGVDPWDAKEPAT